MRRGFIPVSCSWPLTPVVPVRWRGPATRAPLRWTLILVKVTSSLLFLRGETESDTHGGTPRRTANSSDILQMSISVGPLLNKVRVVLMGYSALTPRPRTATGPTIYEQVT